MNKKHFITVNDDERASGFLKPKFTTPDGTKVHTISKRVLEGALKAASDKLKELKDND